MADTRSKKEKHLAILNVLDKGITSPERIGLAVSLSAQTVRKYLTEIVRHRQGTISSKDMNDIMNDAFGTYKMLSYQAMNCLQEAVTPKDKRKAIELWINVQRAEDDLMKKAGIYKEVKKLEITEEEIMNSKSGEQFTGVFLDFLSTEGIDPAKFFMYLDRRAAGEFEPVVVTSEEVPMDRDPEDVYEQHRKARQRKREQKYTDTEHVMSQADSRMLDVRVFGVDDLHIMKSRLMNDTLEDAVERDFLDNAGSEMVEEYLSFKQKFMEEEEKE